LKLLLVGGEPHKEGSSLSHDHHHVTELKAFWWTK